MNDSPIQVFQPNYDSRELEALKIVLAKKWTGRGSEVENLESMFAKYIGVKPEKMIAINSCTEALFQILEYLNLSGFETILPTNSFIGAANAIVNAGMKINFCDINEKTGNPDLEHLIEAFTPKTKVILLQHFGGIPSSMHDIANWARSKNLIIIEDAAAAIGSKFENLHCGTFGDFGVWSLDSMKMIAAGDGGLIYAADENDASKLRTRIYLGLTESTGFKHANKRDKWWEFEIEIPGRRSIMNDLTASIANVQLNKLSANIESRQNNAQFYISKLKDIEELECLVENFLNSSNHYFFPIQISNGKRDMLAKFLLDKGIYTTYRYYPLNLLKFYKNKNTFPATALFAERTLLLPQHSNLTVNQLERICSEISTGLVEI